MENIPPILTVTCLSGPADLLAGQDKLKSTALIQWPAVLDGTGLGRVGRGALQKLGSKG